MGFAEYGTILDMKINRNRNSINNLPVSRHFSAKFVTELVTLVLLICVSYCPLLFPVCS